MVAIVYRSTDTSAPVLSGTVGTLIAVLDACLVSGYGSKAAAGWTKPFTGTNAAVYRPGAGPQHYLDVNDNGAGAGGAVEANIRGYETMSAVATGTGPFPTTAQVASPGLYIRKATVVGTFARPWVLVADDRTFYLFVQTGDLAGLYYAVGFGEFYSYTAGDAYRTFISSRNISGSASANESLSNLSHAGAMQPTTGFYAPRSFNATGTAVALGKHGDAVKNGFSGWMVGTLPYPNTPDGGLYLSPLTISEQTPTSINVVRGRMRGLYLQLHAIANFADGDTFSGAGDYAGRAFLMVKTAQGTTQGIYTLETTAWDTSS